MKTHKGKDGMDYDCLTAEPGCVGECGGLNFPNAVEVVAVALHRILKPKQDDLLSQGGPSEGMKFRARQIVGALEREGLLK